MMAIPVLAITGVFGERRDTVRQARGALVVTAQIPTRFRYRQRMTLDVSVANAGPSVLEDVRVRIDSTYLDRFSSVEISPQVSPDGVVRFGTLPPRTSARLSVSLDGERAGVSRGIAAATDALGDTARVVLASVVFP